MVLAQSLNPPDPRKASEDKLFIDGLDIRHRRKLSCHVVVTDIKQSADIKPFPVSTVLWICWRSFTCLSCRHSSQLDRAHIVDIMFLFSTPHRNDLDDTVISRPVLTVSSTNQTSTHKISTYQKKRGWECFVFEFLFQSRWSRIVLVALLFSSYRNGMAC